MTLSKKSSRLFSAVIHDPFDPRGRWVNELGSVMQIDDYTGGVISGSYVSKVSEDGQSVTGKLIGFITGDTVGFAVNWDPTYSSVTSFSGKVLASENGDPHIYTLWQLSRGVPVESDWWQSFLAGSDTFLREA